MSIETLTGDEFAMLTIDDHEEALILYDQAISRTAQEMVAYEADVEGFADDRDKLTRLITLRKVHQVRRDELESEEEARRTAQVKQRVTPAQIV